MVPEAITVVVMQVSRLGAEIGRIRAKAGTAVPTDVTAAVVPAGKLRHRALLVEFRVGSSMIFMLGGGPVPPPITA